MFGFGGRGFPTSFEAQYCCSSTAMAGKDVDDGDKIYLPPSALDRLARMNVEYPMLFQIANEAVTRQTHCGVLEFSAEEGWCYMPFWMMQNLLVDEGSLITVKNISLPKASFVKFRAQSVDFLEVSNPRALLEVSLRKFTCLTVGDTIVIPYNNQKFALDVREVQPNGAASIIETDCNVDFEEPLGYQDSKYGQQEREAKASSDSSVGTAIKRVPQRARVLSKEEEESAAAQFKAFSGNAKRIDGKKPVAEKEAGSTAGAESKSAGTSTSESSGASQSKAEAGAESKPTVAPIPFKSKIGSKYSTKKTAVSAFNGPAHKLS